MKYDTTSFVWDATQIEEHAPGEGWTTILEIGLMMIDNGDWPVLEAKTGDHIVVSSIGDGRRMCFDYMPRGQPLTVKAKSVEIVNHEWGAKHIFVTLNPPLILPNGKLI